MARLTDLKIGSQVPRAAQKALPARRGPAIWERFLQYIREVRAELTRVDWPSRPELIASTIVVVVVLIVMTIYMGAWDLLFNKLFLMLTEKVRGH